MRVIFLRHGIAEDHGIKADEDRKLTEKGIKKLEKYLPYLAEYLKDKEFEIWSSPKVRADETAKVLTSLLEDHEILTKDFIAYGTVEEMEAELSKVKEGGVVIVGHEPLLSRWVWEITGEDVDIKKGGALEMEIDLNEKSDDLLLWDFKPKEFPEILEREQKLLKKQKNPSLKIALEKVLSQQFNNILKNRDWYLFDNNDIESIHQYRVSIRKFRGIISSLKKLLDIEDYERIQHRFREMAGEAGYLRELDVLIEEYKPIAQEEGILFTKSEVLKALRKERRKEKELLKEFIETEDNREAFVKAYTDLLANLPWKKIEKMKTREFIRPVLDRWEGQILESLENYEEFEFDATHKIRLKAKKFRYVADAFGFYLPDEYRERFKIAKKYQTLLGDTCDAIRNQEALKEIIPEPTGDLEMELNLFLESEIKRVEDFKEKLKNKEWLKIAVTEKVEPEDEVSNEEIPENLPTEIYDTLEDHIAQAEEREIDTLLEMKEINEDILGINKEDLYEDD